MSASIHGRPDSLLQQRLLSDIQSAGVPLHASHSARCPHCPPRHRLMVAMVPLVPVLQDLWLRVAADQEESLPELCWM